ncbi:MAG: 4Fe-4S cluster-binding domain-containing protein [Candidatus Omnitrophica bacterium]|nr:4Fe-4S cluster-binding domain-containing protein [Candidatus Omnitrophota bacterium]
MKKCVLCPRQCGVDRAAGHPGYCKAPYSAVVYSYMAHRGEEPPISGRRGSGTIFFSYCTMKCVYCQNYIFSQQGRGNEVPVEKLTRIMLDLQEEKCHNINLVSPTHFVHQIIPALKAARDEGLNIPVVYNTSGYERVETLKMLAGLVDIYLPDMRYSDNNMAVKYSDAPDYVEYNRAAVKEMHAQVGDLMTGDDGVAKKGLIIRLLALPHNISGTIETLKFIKENISKNTYLSIMSQYYPTFKALDHKELAAGLDRNEYKNVVDACRLLELNNGWIQEMPPEPDDKFLGTKIIKPRD